jgi:hypothetical protein
MVRVGRIGQDLSAGTASTARAHGHNQDGGSSYRGVPDSIAGAGLHPSRSLDKVSVTSVELLSFMGTVPRV